MMAAAAVPDLQRIAARGRRDSVRRTERHCNGRSDGRQGGDREQCCASQCKMFHGVSPCGTCDTTRREDRPDRVGNYSGDIGALFHRTELQANSKRALYASQFKHAMIAKADISVAEIMNWRRAPGALVSGWSNE
jgi:hypothetical protein